MAEPCCEITIDPPANPLTPGTYTLAACCANPDHFVKVTYSVQGTGPLLVPVNPDPPGPCVDWTVDVPPGHQGLVVTARCFKHFKDVSWVCQEVASYLA
jgi:hypothetical protein